MDNVFRTYLDSHSKKKVSLGDKLQSKVPEKERPKTPIMKEIQHSIHSKIDENFKAYLQVRNGHNCKQSKLGIRTGTLQWHYFHGQMALYY